VKSFDRWLDERDPPPPPALAARVRAAVDSPTAPASAIPTAALDAGVETLAAVLDEGDATRASAIDLLAADALVTYAFEAAAQTPAGLDALAGAAMGRIARLATAER
jgi:hypothetical protein